MHSVNSNGPPFLQKLKQVVLRFERTPSIRKALPIIALVIGVAWVIALSGRLGIQEGGDTDGYLAAAELLRKGGFTFSNLFGNSTGNMLYHMTHVWLFLLGKTGFVVFTATLTAFLPYFLVTILKRSGVKTFFIACALFYVGTNEEIYKWAFYVLSDGIMLSQIMLLLFLLMTPGRPWYLWPLLVIVWYSLYFSRSTGFLLNPAVILFALIIDNPTKRKFILGLFLIPIGFIGVTAGVQRTEARRPGVLQASIVQNVLDLDRRDFTKGHLLMDEKMTEKLSVPFTEKEAVGQTLSSLCWSHKSYCVYYWVRKYLAYVLPIYPKYSFRHNLFNLLFFGSSMLLSAGGFITLLYGIRRKGWKTLKTSGRDGLGIYVMTGMLILTASLFHTAAQIDPDARYLMVWVTPWIGFNFLQANLAYNFWSGPSAAD